MTRRRDVLPPDAAAYLAGSRTLLLVCADRGQHPRTVLGTVTAPAGGRPCVWLPVNRARLTRQPGAGVWIDDAGRPVVNVACPRCGRHKRWRRPAADGHARRVLAAGLHTVDIGALP